MNDPGLEKPIQEKSNDLEKERKDEDQMEKEDEQSFLNPRHDILPEEALLKWLPTNFVTTAAGGSLRRPFRSSLYVSSTDLL